MALMIKILVVDDSASFRPLFADHLRRYSGQVRIDEAIDAAEAWEKMRDETPDLLFVDIQLPGESGLELTRKVKAARPGVTIAILTNHDIPEYEHAAHECGADHFFSKGTSTMDDLMALVNGLASRSRHVP